MKDWIGEYVGLSFALLPGLALAVPLIFVEPLPKAESTGEGESAAAAATTAAAE